MTNRKLRDSALRVGIVGMGWAGETHLKAYQQLPNVDVIAIADPREERLTQLQRTYNIPDVHTHFGPLVERPDLDIVSVCTPNQFHAPISIAALENGKHVLCEKPLARSSAEGEAMVRAAVQAGRVLEVAFNHRQRGDVSVLKQMIDEGQLGHIYHAKASWMRRSGIPGMGGWFTNRELAGGGPLIDLGVHVLDMALYLMDEPEVVAVSAATYAELGPRGRGGRNDARTMDVGPFEVEDLATAFIRLAGGATLLLEASWAVYGRAGDDFGVTLYGSDGGADIEVHNYNWENTLTVYTDIDGKPAVLKPEVPKGTGHSGVIANFVSIIESGDWSAHVGSEGLRRTQIIAPAAKASA